ncbi:sulfopyruvate decarboxylase alpha subunit [Bradyrhizobium sp. S3.14.4]
MALAEQQTSPQAAQGVSDRSWHGIVLQTLKRNEISLIPYVPDRVLTPLIKNLHADPFFTTFATAREEEAVGIVSGAWMGGRRGAVLMQTSGFATLANVLASLAVPYQIPLIMFVSERGTLGEFNYGQSLVCRTMRPVLDSLALEHHTITRLDELEFIADRSIKQAVTTQAPVALILNPLLTGGKVFRQVRPARMSTDLDNRNTKVMNRFDVTSRLIARLKHEEAVIGGIGNTNFDLWAAGHRPQNFYMLGSMGLAFPIALGVALAQPDRRVFALEGDGSLLMQLGALATIAALRPKNLIMIVMDNGIYQITGAQPTPAASVADIVAIASGSGLANSAWAADEEDFERLVDEALSASEPSLIAVRIDDKPGVGTTRRDPVQIRERFMHGLGVREPL